VSGEPGVGAVSGGCAGCSGVVAGWLWRWSSSRIPLIIRFCRAIRFSALLRRSSTDEDGVADKFGGCDELVGGVPIVSGDAESGAIGCGLLGVSEPEVFGVVFSAVGVSAVGASGEARLLLTSGSLR